jgi:hypothetical protein
MKIMAGEKAEKYQCGSEIMKSGNSGNEIMAASGKRKRKQYQQQ